LKLSEIQEKN